MIESQHDPLLTIYVEVLALDVVAQGDEAESFFALGGSSMLSLLLLERVADELGVDVPVEDFYEAPTLAGLRAAVAAHSRPTPG